MNARYLRSRFDCANSGPDRVLAAAFATIARQRAEGPTGDRIGGENTVIVRPAACSAARFVRAVAVAAAAIAGMAGVETMLAWIALP